MSRGVTVRAHPDVVFQKLGDEAVLLNLRTGVYWGLNPTGAKVWDHIVKHGVKRDEVGAVVAALRQEFAGSDAEMGATVQSLLEELSREGLVVLDEGA
jgi:hypothetical protein